MRLRSAFSVRTQRLLLQEQEASVEEFEELGEVVELHRSVNRFFFFWHSAELAPT